MGDVRSTRTSKGIVQRAYKDRTCRGGNHNSISHLHVLHHDGARPCSPTASSLLLFVAGRTHFLLESTIRNLEAGQPPQSNAEDRQEDQSHYDAHEDAFEAASAEKRRTKTEARDSPGVKNWYFSNSGKDSHRVLFSLRPECTDLMSLFRSMCSGSTNCDS